mgnify:CR=1 FL=1
MYNWNDFIKILYNKENLKKGCKYFFIKGEKFINWLKLYTKLCQRPIRQLKENQVYVLKSEKFEKEYFELKLDKNGNLYFEKGEKKE